jgi:hypothetical protein
VPIHETALTESGLGAGVVGEKPSRMPDHAWGMGAGYAALGRAAPCAASTGLGRRTTTCAPCHKEYECPALSLGLAA